ncbi:hypothetical protein [Aquimarina brevivitae]|uniref:Uncharacterized protein n=1 Tax=Aquimarina brevivitae TaxID=323412 RepID=A0A4Q7P5A6_9FLAO|nr:hypothetical protein [Aquimarina brevivitae]RZS93902.1 hypothetical protein EV197_2483 [Aquimarina brevivitae]
MLNNILKLEGVQKLNQEAKKAVKGGTDYGNFETCLRLCGGSCTLSGRCFLMER